MAMVFPDQFGTFLQFQQALDALRASSWLEPSISGGGAFPPLNLFSFGRRGVASRTSRIQGPLNNRRPRMSQIHQGWVPSAP